MTDYFSLLNEPRRPWLDAESLKGKFLAASAEIHPDRVHTLGDAERAAAQERATELNAAYNCLKEPKDRLRHMLELELGVLPKDIQQIPAALMDLSMTIGLACREADAFLVEKAKATSPLLKVQFMERGQRFTEKLEVLQAKVRSLNEHLLTELKQLDAEWIGAADHGTLMSRLEEVYRLLSYVARWTGQLQERVVRLYF